MSDNNVQNEQELWDLLSEPVTTDAKAEPEKKAAKPKSGPRFAKPESAQEAAPAPVREAAPAPAKEGRKLDGFFYACMAGVAAVSVAATLLISGMTGGEKVPGPVETNPPVTGEAISGADSEAMAALERENAELRAQVELQKDQIKKLQADILDLSAGSAELPTISTEPGADNELINEQLEAYDLFNRIKEAYADFDRATLEELIPEMDKRLSYLSTDAMNEYYLILEYVEMPSNG